jgi:hypothetical protein
VQYQVIDTVQRAIAEDFCGGWTCGWIAAAAGNNHQPEPGARASRRGGIRGSAIVGHHAIELRFASAARVGVDHSNGGSETWGAGVFPSSASPSCSDPPIDFDLEGGNLELHTTHG